LPPRPISGSHCTQFQKQLLNVFHSACGWVWPAPSSSPPSWYGLNDMSSCHSPALLGLYETPGQTSCNGLHESANPMQLTFCILILLQQRRLQTGQRYQFHPAARYIHDDIVFSTMYLPYQRYLEHLPPKCNYLMCSLTIG
jgi:hypothetical protein